MQSDGEKSLGKNWDDFIADEGITFMPSPPYTPSQNGYAERSGGVIISVATRIYHASGLPIELWPEFISQACRILNRLPIKRGRWISPYEFVFHYKPDLSQFRAVGSKAWVLIQKAKREKLTLHTLHSKAVEGWLVGMSASNIYRVWIPDIDRVIVSRDVRVDEGVKFDPRELEDKPPLSQRKIITILEHDLDKNEIKELIKKKKK
jgi:hypothetical protein